MSHDDEPTPFRFELLQRRRGPLWTGIGLIVIGGLLAGYGIGCTVIDVNHDAPLDYESGSVVGILCVVGTVLAVAGLLRWTFAITPYPADLTDWHGASLLTLAAGVGLAVATFQLEVGGGYSLAVVGAGAICIGLGALAEWVARRRIARRERARELIAGGVAVTATVVASGLGKNDFDEASTVITSADFEFTAADGVTRKVTRRLHIPQRAPLEVGQRTVVWHAADDPGADDSIVVAIEHALRWNLDLPRPADDGPADRA